VAARRRRQPDLVSVDSQREWLEKWCGRERGGLGSALGTARAKLRVLHAVEDEGNREIIAVTAVSNAYRRISRVLDRRGALPEAGSGFRGYCRVVLNNEVARQLSSYSRRFAGPLSSGEAASVRVPPELAAVEGTTSVLELRAWVLRWHEALVARHVAFAGADTLLSVELGSRRATVPLVGSPYRDDMLVWPVPSATGTSLRVHNECVVPVHVVVVVRGARHETSPRNDALRLIDTTRGIGMAPTGRDVVDDTVTGARRSTRLVALSARAPMSPRKIAVRTFEPCRGHDVDMTALRTFVRSELAALNAARVATDLRITPSASAWLGAANVLQAARRVWRHAPRDPEQLVALVCALAEWAEPGLHPPHRGGHPGAHPLERKIHAVVEALATTRAQRHHGSPNTQTQASKRLRDRTASLLGAVGLRAHRRRFDVISRS
jgi:hypothetical protein